LVLRSRYFPYFTTERVGSPSAKTKKRKGLPREWKKTFGKHPANSHLEKPRNMHKGERKSGTIIKITERRGNINFHHLQDARDGMEDEGGRGEGRKRKRPKAHNAKSGSGKKNENLGDGGDRGKHLFRTQGLGSGSSGGYFEELC